MTTAQEATKIGPPIVREPAYRSGAVRYALLLFGPRAETRVWLAHDGDTLYVDRDGDGDLTQEGEKVPAKEGEYTDPEAGVFVFEAGDIPDGERTHTGLRVGVYKLDYLADRDERVREILARDPSARRYTLAIDVEVPGHKGIGLGGRVEHYASIDATGFLQFAERPQDAPVVRFSKPWQVTLCRRHRLTVGRENDLILGVGTPGFGPGTTALIGYTEVIPLTAFPTAEVVYPPEKPGSPPVRELYELKERC
ncbi:MAG TPA: hypothetical protein VIL46_06370 [Gemmataceae bacterium]